MRMLFSVAGQPYTRKTRRRQFAAAAILIVVGSAVWTMRLMRLEPKAPPWLSDTASRDARAPVRAAAHWQAISSGDVRSLLAGYGDAMVMTVLRGDGAPQTFEGLEAARQWWEEWFRAHRRASVEIVGSSAEGANARATVRILFPDGSGEEWEESLTFDEHGMITSERLSVRVIPPPNSPEESPASPG